MMSYLQKLCVPVDCVLRSRTLLSARRVVGGHNYLNGRFRSTEIDQNESEMSTPAPREFYGAIRQIKTSPMKLNLVAKLIRGMQISMALAQLKFCEKKAANFVEMVLLDTQRRAVQDHEAEPLNLWVAESYVGKGKYFKRIRYHGKGMAGIMHKYHAHYFLRLKEGRPVKKIKNLEDTWKYRTRKYIKAGPRSIPNAL